MRKTLTLGELKPNPFKHSINGGKLWPNKIEELKRSITKNGLWEFFVARYADGEYQIANHHHTLAAAVEVLGKKHEVSVQIEKYDDSHMLSAMADENSEEGTPGVDLRDTVLTVQKFLREHPEACSYQLAHRGPDDKSPRGGKPHECGSTRCVAAFFSRLSRTTVQRYSQISDEVAPYVSDQGQSHPERTGTIGAVAAAAISNEFKDDPESQKKVIKVVVDANKGRNEPLLTTKDITDAMKNGDPIEALKGTVKNKKLDEAIEQEEKAKKPAKGKKKRKVTALVKPEESISNLIDALSLDGVQARFMELVPYEAAKSLHRELVKLYHPDKGGNETKMTELNLLWKRIEKDQYERGAK